MKIKALRFFTLIILFSVPISAEGTGTSSAESAESPRVVYKESFEGNAKDWRRERRAGKSPDIVDSPKLDTSRKSEGQKSIIIDTAGTKIRSGAIHLPPSRRFELCIDTFSEKYHRFHLRVEEYDKNKKLLSSIRSGQTGDALWHSERRGKRNYWYSMTLPFDTSDQCRYVRICINKWSNDKVWIDNVKISQLESRRIYQAEPVGDKDSKEFSRYSSALPGPDDILYPNWTWAGRHFNKSVPGKTFNVEDFGAVPDDGQCDADALEKACRAAGKAGGGVVSLKAGAYRLTRKIMVVDSYVVLRGAGRDSTRIQFTLPNNGVGIFPVTRGHYIGEKTNIQVFFPLDKVKLVSLFVDDKKLTPKGSSTNFKPLPGDSNYSVATFTIGGIRRSLKDGLHKIRAEVKYEGEASKASSIPFIKDSEENIGEKYQNAIISFVGKRFSRNAAKLTTDAKRGDREICLSDTSSIRKGDYLSIHAPPNEHWNSLVFNKCKWGTYRMFVALVDDIEDNKVTIAQPLRIDFPVEDKSEARAFQPLTNCGIEDLTISQLGQIQQDLKIGGVIFCHAANCWAKKVTVDRPGTFGVFGNTVKWCEISDCVFKDPWWTKGGGSLAYVGWERAWDCLIENIETFNVRHGPILNWSCSGNVFRKSIFHGSDGQFHAGWTRDNLIEQCVIESTTRENSGYGYGFYATPFDDSDHGPQGPRNVIYNCRSKSMREGVYLGGMNQQWMIMYNFFVVGEGPGILSRLGNRDNWIVGNVFILKDRKSPLIYNEFIDNKGDRLLNNTVYGGNGLLFGGPGKPEVDKDNIFRKLSRTCVSPANPPVPSIYEWQMVKYGADTGMKR